MKDSIAFFKADVAVIALMAFVKLLIAIAPVRNVGFL